MQTSAQAHAMETHELVINVSDADGNGHLAAGSWIFWERGYVRDWGTLAAIFSQGNPFLEWNKITGNI